jgi:hypothetical protein
MPAARLSGSVQQAVSCPAIEFMCINVSVNAKLNIFVYSQTLFMLVQSDTEMVAR